MIHWHEESKPTALHASTANMYVLKTVLQDLNPPHASRECFWANMHPSCHPMRLLTHLDVIPSDPGFDSPLRSPGV